MGLFNPNAYFLSDVNLLLQLAILVVLILAVFFKARQSYLRHGALMGIAVTLHTVLIFSIMVPSFASLVGSFGNLLWSSALVILLHAVLGSLVELLGLYLVLAWALNRWNVKVCFGNKRFMKPTIILWLIEIALGTYVYVLLYVPL
ncbi:MAG: hypothetical protein WCD81_10955 [Candidatus Bathyarchaeia archaeon]